MANDRARYEMPFPKGHSTMHDSEPAEAGTANPPGLAVGGIVDVAADAHWRALLDEERARRAAAEERARAAEHAAERAAGLHAAFAALCVARDPQALERAALYDVARRACEDADAARRRLALLVDASELFASSLDEDESLANAARAGVPELSDWCVAMRWSDDGEPPLCKVAHASPAKERRLRALVEIDPDWLRRALQMEEGTTAAPRIRDDCAELLIRIAADDPTRAQGLRDVGLVSAITAPMAAKRGRGGALLFASARHGYAYGHGELVVAEELARRAAQALENARLHREIESSIRAREDLLAMVSHDLKNPLTTILVGATVLVELPSEGLPGGERAKKVAGTIQRSAQKMAQLVKDLLDLARIRQGKIALDLQPWAASYLLEQTFDLLRPLAVQKGQELVGAERDPALLVRCDKERVGQVLSNVVGNAVKFSPEGALIIVECTHVGGEVRFAVKDAGPGMSAEEAKHVFERYWQGAKDARGTGLGLCIAKGLIEAHGGRIWIDSAVGAGTTLSFTLPMVDWRGST